MEMENTNVEQNLNNSSSLSYLITPAPHFPKRKKEAIVDWLELPDHLIVEIMGKLTCSLDYARFGAVCVKWRSLILNAEEEECLKLPPQLPLLIVPTYKEEEEEEEEVDIHQSCSFYTITHEKVAYNRLQLRVPCDMHFYGPGNGDRHFQGSGHGWLIAVDDDKLSNFPIQLINPFFLPDPKVIPLPPLTTFPLDEDDFVHNSTYFRKAVLSADPISNPKNYMVMAIYGGFGVDEDVESARLAFFKPSQDETKATTWTQVHCYDGFKGLFEDVIYYKDKFYAVDNYGAVVVCNVASRTFKEVVGPPVNELENCTKKYLVESGGDLLQVHREVNFMAYPCYYTAAFKVFKLSSDPTGSSKPHWVEVKDLCDRVLFLGHNASLSISVSDFPGCEANCIYYTDDSTWIYYFDRQVGPHDMGVFNLGNNSFEKHYPTEIGTPIWPAPIWIEPILPRRCFNMN